MNQLGSKIDPKIVLVVSLIVGLLAGYLLDNTIVSQPRIQSLTETVTEQDDEIQSLTQSLGDLQGDYDSLQSSYDELSGESEQQYQEQQTQILELQAQIESLQSSVENLEEIVETQETENEALETQLMNIRNRYDSIYNPTYIDFSIDDININLTIDTDIYPENDDLKGFVSITHSDGTLFNGSFKLLLSKVYVPFGTPSEFYDIYGETDFTWTRPYILGSGSYKLALGEVRDSQGELLISNNQLKPYTVFIFQG